MRGKLMWIGWAFGSTPLQHAMLRQSKRTHHTPLAQPVWASYSSAHFCPDAAAQIARAGVGLSARDMAIPLGRNHNTEALLRLDWEMNGRASPGFDCVAAPFTKYATVLRPQMSGRGNEPVNVKEPFIGRLFKLLYDKACIPDCWKHAKLTPLYKKGPLLDPNSYSILA
eukprot:1148341-Pelagomonas_calceolata.AAC.1